MYGEALLLHFGQSAAALAHGLDESIYGDARFVVCMASMKAAAAVFLVIAIIASIAFAQDPNNASSGASHIERSGPVSTWPASWTDFCSQSVFGISLPVFGTKTTNVQMLAPPGGTLPNESLDQIYARIVNSTGFKNASAGFGWVTIFWGFQEAGPVRLSERVCHRPVHPNIWGPPPTQLSLSELSRPTTISARGPCQSRLESARAARLGDSQKLRRRRNEPYTRR